MAKKRRQREAAPERASSFSSRQLLLGLGVVLVFAVAAATAVTFIRGDSSEPPPTEDQTDVSPLIPTAGPAPSAPASSAAGLLATKEWAAMDPSERELVIREVTRVWGGARTRVSRGDSKFPTDVFRSGGRTLVMRDYESTLLDQRRLLGIGLAFYCDEASGQVTEHRYGIVPGANNYVTKTLDPKNRPWDTILRDADWTTTRDLGLADVDGRRARGLATTYPLLSGPSTYDGEHWFDVNTGELIEWRITDATGSQTYHFAAATLPPIEVPADQPQPDCVRRIAEELAARTGS